MRRRVPANHSKFEIGRYLSNLLTALAIGIFTYHVLAFFNSLDDDAFIPIRYALNFVHGHGWVMNPGERVEGTTSALHVWLLTATFRFFSIDQVIWIEKLGGYLLGLGVLWQTISIARFMIPSAKWTPPLVAALLAARPEFALSMTNGLETGLAVILVTSGLNWFLRGRFQISAFCFVAAALTRPEMIAIYPLLLLTHRGSKPEMLKSAALYVVPLLAFFLARWLYFGDILPNTFYAKRMPLSEAAGPGLEYLARYLSYGPYPVAFLMLIFPLLGLTFARKGRTTLAAFLIVPIGFIVGSSGSWMQDGRFAAPAMPAMALLWGLAAVKVFNSLRYPALIGAIGGTALCFLVSETMARDQEIGQIYAMHTITEPGKPWPMGRWRASNEWGRRLMGDWIREHVPKGETVACSEMGVPAVMNPDVRFIDFRGLSDATVARMHRDVHHSNVGVYLDGWADFDNELLDYILVRRPYAIIAFDAGQGTNSRLQSAYSPSGEFEMGENGWLVKTWIRK